MKYFHLWKITEVESQRKITYKLKCEDHTGDSFVTFELSEHGGNNLKLKLIHRVTENFPADIPEFTRESCLEGWNWFVKDSLKGYLDCM
ncbi:MAG: SRPBCC domain-containing protein [Brumimicrobium sp.]